MTNGRKKREIKIKIKEEHVIAVMAAIIGSTLSSVDAECAVTRAVILWNKVYDAVGKSRAKQEEAEGAKQK